MTTMRRFDNGETVTLKRRVVKVIDGQRQFDAYGNVIYATYPQTVTGISIWPETTSEALQSVDRTTTVYVVALPTDIVLDAIDVLTWRGLDYEVQGEPTLYRSPYTGTDLQTIRMSRVEG